MSTTTFEQNLEFLAEKLNNNLMSLVDSYSPYLLFAPGGGVRLGTILGWLLGLAQTENQELAEKLWQDFQRGLYRLSRACGKMQLEFSSDVTIEVPARKVVLNSDRSLHGFSIQMFHPVNPQVVAERLAEFRKTWSEPEPEILQRVLDSLNIWRMAQGLELTERTWHPQIGWCDTYYTPGCNGGFLYHGPSGGETFAVTLDNASYWQLHT